jgi:hypothetical protein
MPLPPFPEKPPVPGRQALDVDAAEQLARALKRPFVDLETYSISCGVLGKVPAELCCRLRCVPMIHSKRRVVLVVDDPFAEAFLAANQELLGPPYRFPLEFALSTTRGIDAALRKRLAMAR